jgi:transposase
MIMTIFAGIAEFEQGKPAREIASVFNVHPATIYRLAPS